MMIFQQFFLILNHFPLSFQVTINGIFRPQIVIFTIYFFGGLLKLQYGYSSCTIQEFQSNITLTPLICPSLRLRGGLSLLTTMRLWLQQPFQLLTSIFGEVTIHCMLSLTACRHPTGMFLTRRLLAKYLHHSQTGLYLIYTMPPISTCWPLIEW